MKGMTTMGIIRGIKNMQRHDEQQEAARANRGGERVKWLSSIFSKNADPDVKIKPGEKAEIIFLQELDETSERYSEKNGLGFLVVEHNNPSKTDFWRRATCINDEEHDFQCWGCEKNRQEWEKERERKARTGDKENEYKGGWGPKTNFYIAVLVRYVNMNGDKVEEVMVMQRAKTNNSYVDEIIDLAIEDGFISNRTFLLARKGEGFDTKYTLRAKDEDAGVDVESYDIPDLDALINDVEYDSQAATLGVAVAPKAVSVGASDDGPDPEDGDDGDDWL